jgi:enoyl-CoA hydratase/carnithine racemase
MTDTGFRTPRISRAGGVATITIDNPPVNVLDVPLMSEIRSILLSLRDDPNTRVIVFQSADRPCRHDIDR